MNAFSTGSRTYGTPRPDSDVDLCVLVSPETLAILRQGADRSLRQEREILHQERVGPNGTLSGRESEEEDPGDSLYFGKLNLICHTNPVVHEAWFQATLLLKAQAPVSRAYACQTIKAMVHDALEAERE